MYGDHSAYDFNNSKINSNNRIRSHGNTNLSDDQSTTNNSITTGATATTSGTSKTSKNTKSLLDPLLAAGENIGLDVRIASTSDTNSGGASSSNFGFGFNFFDNSDSVIDCATANNTRFNAQIITSTSSSAPVSFDPLTQAVSDLENTDKRKSSITNKNTNIGVSTNANADDDAGLELTMDDVIKLAMQFRRQQ